jgi:hypothetical protein
MNIRTAAAAMTAVAVQPSMTTCPMGAKGSHWVAIPLGSSSATPVIRPGSSRERSSDGLAVRGRRSARKFLSTCLAWCGRRPGAVAIRHRHAACSSASPPTERGDGRMVRGRRSRDAAPRRRCRRRGRAAGLYRQIGPDRGRQECDRLVRHRFSPIPAGERSAPPSAAVHRRSFARSRA